VNGRVDTSRATTITRGAYGPHERLPGHEGAVDVAEPRKRQRRLREVVDDHAQTARGHHADDPLPTAMAVSTSSLAS
jgi:hypothetical protein